MELSCARQILCECFGTTSTADLSVKLVDDLLNGITERLTRYKEKIQDDLEKDTLRAIYQYDLADRKEAKQDFTPDSLCRLVARLTDTGGATVYDLCSGTGALTIAKWAQNPNRRFICEELDDDVVPYLLTNLAIRNIDGIVIHRNALSLEKKAVYILTRGNSISHVSCSEDAPEIAADEIVSNPPFNIKWIPPTPLTADDRFLGKVIPPAQNANFAFVMTALNRLTEKGRAAIILPCGVLQSSEEAEVRKYLIENGLLEEVFLMPERMFESTSVSTCVLVLSHGNDAVKMYDLRQNAAQEQRGQRGQYGGASHTGRVYQKVLNVLTDETISSICGECDNHPGFSRLVSVEEIAQNGYSFAPLRYIPFDWHEDSHRPYADIMADINRVARERSVLKITINETLAKETGLYEVAQLEASNHDAEIDKTFALVGGHYEGRRYISMTKSKEFKVENQDKEIWSHLLHFFLPIWKQHIYYLNMEENRLLAELRDAMLPELMSGKLIVS